MILGRQIAVSLSKSTKELLMFRFALAFVPALGLAAMLAIAQDKPAGGGNAMLYSVDSEKSLAKLREDLPKACASRKFGVLSVIDLKEKMKEKGVEYGGECLIFEVCNPQKAKQALEANPEISTALPCRISVFRTKDGKTRIATIRPTKLLDLFNSAELKQIASEVEETISAIMNEAAR
jgi:uncharacterized protein (DUF302 family)